ncbi:MAG: PRC-barrel domain-containing protein, partial [Candidatus Eiseniibacteriota bacterium]
GLPLMQPPHPPGMLPRDGEQRAGERAGERAAAERAAPAGEPTGPSDGAARGTGQLPGASGADPALRSLREVRDYAIHAVDGEIGRLDDLIVDDDGWLIRWLIIDTGHWLPGRHVIVAPDWIQEISWKDSEVVVSLSQNQIENSPEFDLDTVPDRRYEIELREHYGRDRAAPGPTVED